MINFFRKIRQKTLTNNKFSKYLLYAIGEIILVVIGILIALQINNWNESTKLGKEETLYLKRLKIDLEKDTLYYNKNIARANLLIDRNTSFLKQIYDKQKSIEEGRELMNIPLWDSEYLTIQDNTFRELVSSGKLNIISNSKLKVAVVDLYRLIESNGNNIKEGNEYSRELMANYASTYPGAIKQTRNPKELMNFVNDEMFRMEDFQFLNNPSSSQFQSLEDVILVYIAKHEGFIILFEELKDKSKDVLYQIEQEINENK
ncbi:DUF6090 family protein [Christiangramia sabulilitoris]|uniref:Uncharacterized protein n=1 Tax=Christiangramia sabulilitoris TaxID=2583991 RepID=A0A550I730_9FLAO|nr:DUF6090 family protein [Christiangramia sabulilitoris]TRO66782.1 hypothetical protein FGM01_02510 [Christiangramia sabulilitoris]